MSSFGCKYRGLSIVTPLWTVLLCSGLMALGAISGCGGSSGAPVETSIVPYTRDQIAARETAEFAEYRIRNGDRLAVTFKYLPELDQNNVLVLPDGNITMAGLGSVVKASGMSIRELDARLTGEFGMDYKDPDLSVVVTDITDPEIYVLGEVKNPGLYRLPSGGTGVIQAVAAAGGFQDEAKPSETVILRATAEGFMIRSFDLGHLEQTGIQSLNFLDIQPFDIVFVPRSSLGDLAYLTEAILGTGINIASFFWDIYAIGNLDKIERIAR